MTGWAQFSRRIVVLVVSELFDLRGALLVRCWGAVGVAWRIAAP